MSRFFDEDEYAEGREDEFGDIFFKKKKKKRPIDEWVWSGNA